MLNGASANSLNQTQNKNAGKTYTIPILKPSVTPAAIAWDSVISADICEYVWGGEYRPRAQAQLVFVPDDGFYARLSCCETSPRAVYRNFFDPVYRDSCLEFFAVWNCETSDYINIEMNAAGAMLSAVGPDRERRRPITDFLTEPFSVKAASENGCWSVTVRIGIDDLEKLTGLKKERLVSGYAFRGNFYKCGDDTDMPHYGSWNPISLPAPDFHCPDHFGTLVLGNLEDSVDKDGK